MFEFYRLVTNPDTHQEEVVLCQLPEDEEGLALKVRLQQEISGYEKYRTVVTESEPIKDYVDIRGATSIVEASGIRKKRKERG